MSMMQKFEKDFVERTMELLECRFEKEENEVTLLLNCLLALVTLPSEYVKNKKSKRVKAFKIKCAEKLKELSDPSTFLLNKDEYALKRVRNAVAHVNINIESDSNNKIAFLTLESKEHGRNGACNMRAKISVDNLRMFAEYVAQEYINMMNNNITEESK